MAQDQEPSNKCPRGHPDCTDYKTYPCQHPNCEDTVSGHHILETRECARCHVKYCDTHRTQNGREMCIGASCVNGGGDFLLFFCGGCITVNGYPKPWPQHINVEI